MSNTTLRHWDFATHFTGEEAAALIMGIDPNLPKSEVDTTYPIVERMRSAYQNALGEAIWAYEFKDGAGVDQSLVDITEKSTGLYSYRMFHISGHEFEIVRLSIPKYVYFTLLYGLYNFCLTVRRVCCDLVLKGGCQIFCCRRHRNWQHQACSDRQC